MFKEFFGGNRHGFVFIDRVLFRVLYIGVVFAIVYTGDCVRDYLREKCCLWQAGVEPRCAESLGWVRPHPPPPLYVHSRAPQSIGCEHSTGGGGASLTSQRTGPFDKYIDSFQYYIDMWKRYIESVPYWCGFR